MRSEGDGADGGPGRPAPGQHAADTGERLETFVVKLVVDRRGVVHRSNVEHVRTGIERWFATWPDEGADQFVAQMAMLPSGRPRAARPDGARTARRITLDGGHLIGGSIRPLCVVLILPPETGPPERAERHGYVVTAVARRLGTDVRTELGSQSVEPSELNTMTLLYPAIQLDAGIHRLELEIERSTLLSREIAQFELMTGVAG